MTLTSNPTRADYSSGAGLDPDADLVDVAASLVPLIRDGAEAGSAQYRVTPEVIRQLTDSRLLRLTVPARYDGGEVNSRTLVDVLAELARGDGSTGWSAMLLNIGNWFATTWPVRAQDEIWADDPDARCCVVLAPTGRGRRTQGGWVVSGRWPYASGSFAATHAIMGFLAPQDDGAPRPLLGILQPGQWTVERSWAPIGLRGTGSDTVIADEVFVPDHRVQGFDDMVGGRYLTELAAEEPRARAAFLPAGTVVFGAIQVGLGRAALELAVDRMKAKGVVGATYTESRNSPYHQFTVAQATGKIDAAELLMHRSCRDIDAAALSGAPMDELQRARVRNDVGFIVELINEAVDGLLKAAGTSSYMQSNPLGRIAQDVITGGSHVHAAPAMGNDAYGKLLLGADGPLPVHV